MPPRTQFQKTILSNGLTIVSERISRFRSLSLGVWVKVGTRHESLPVAGVSHYLEHMLFKGTKKRSALDIARQVDQVGGEFNAFTTRENTCFHLLLLNQSAGLGLDILSDILLHSTFKKDEFERERKVILQEISMVEDSPEEMAHDYYYQLIYGTGPKGEVHGLGKPILGSVQSVQDLRRAQLLQFFFENYRPEQILVSVAGDVSHEEILRKLKPLARMPWPGRPTHSKNPNRISTSIPAPGLQSGAWWIHRPTEQTHLIWGVQGPHYQSPDRYAAYLLNVYLGGGMSSSLFQEIREKKGLAYTVYSSLTPYTDSGVFYVYAATGTENIPICLKLIEKSVQSLKSKLLTRQELRMIQENLKGSVLLSADSVESRMSSIARNEMVLGRYVSVDEVCRDIDAVTPKDIQRMARQLFDSEKRSILAYGPKPKKLPADFRAIKL